MTLVKMKTPTMDASIYDRFFNELIQGAGSFLGLPQQGALSILSDILSCMEVAVMVLKKSNDQPENRIFVDALDSLLTVCEKLPKARLLRSYVGRIAGATGKQYEEKRKVLLTELKDFLDKAQRRLKRV
ncbi:MAG: hypothetical protein IKP58_03725 [Victivallales bacterium]|nr:hypothetical protein [Victivallales bacterium]